MSCITTKIFLSYEATKMAFHTRVRRKMAEPLLSAPAAAGLCRPLNSSLLSNPLCLPAAADLQNEPSVGQRLRSPSQLWDSAPRPPEESARGVPRITSARARGLVTDRACSRTQEPWAGVLVTILTCLRLSPSPVRPDGATHTTSLGSCERQDYPLGNVPKLGSD